MSQEVVPGPTVMDWAQLAAPFLAALFAALFGAIIYRHQKRVDREEAFYEAKRENYHRFLGSMARLRDSVTSSETEREFFLVGNEEMREAHRDLAILGLYAAPGVFGVAKELVNEFEMLTGADIDEFDKPTKITVDHLSKEMRADLFKTEREK